MSEQLNSKQVRIVCISDLHSLPLPSPLPPGDILIVAGDLTEGRPSQLLSRLEELQELKSQFPHIFVIAGNHDRALDEKCDTRDAAIYDDTEKRAECRKAFRTASGITYLENSGVQISGKDAQDSWATIPTDTDIVITHGPPLGYLDQDGLGCDELRKALWRVKPSVHVFGHVHEGHGSLELRFDEMQKNHEAAVSEWKLVTMVDQPSQTARKYIPRHLRSANLPPFPKLPGDKQMIEDGLLRQQKETILVNASIKGMPPFHPIVIHI